MTDPWLEQELTRQLSPVHAPAALWDRIHEQRRPLRVSRSLRPQALLAVIVLAVLAVGLIGRRPLDLRALSEKELSAGVSVSDPQEVRAWLRQQANIDLDLPNHRVSIVSARLITWKGQPAAAVTFKVGEQRVAMLVTGKQVGSGLKHESPRIESTPGARFVSWNMGGASYMAALAGPPTGLQAFQAACVLCHTEPQTSLAFN